MSIRALASLAVILVFTGCKGAELRPSAYHRQRVSMFGAIHLPPNAIVLLGDSHIDNANWDEILGHSIVNRGIGGDTIDLLRQRISILGRGRPCTVLLMVGINDLVRGRSVSDMMVSYTQLLVELQRIHPGVRVVIHGLLPVNTSLFSDGVRNKDIGEMNERLEELALRSPGYTFVAPPPQLSDADDELDPIFTFDGLHLNGAGYQVWATALHSHVQCTPSATS